MIKNKKKIDGVLLLDKSSGISSNRALQEVKYLLQAQKAGHTGSLDPLASGVLPICFGEASKFARFLLDADKTYIVTAKLGVVTDSGDAEGQILQHNAVPVLTVAEVKTHIQTFLGSGLQVPSMFSALKHNGQPLYKLARQNKVVERAPRPIHVYSYELLEFSGDMLTCQIKCSKGTYIRTLIEDLGQALGCGAHVTALRRVTAGAFTIEECVAFATLQNAGDPTSYILPMTVLLEGLQKISLSAALSDAICKGQKITTDLVVTPGTICLFSDQNELLGIGEAQNYGNIVPVRLVATHNHATPQSHIML